MKTVKKKKKNPINALVKATEEQSSFWLLSEYKKMSSNKKPVIQTH